MRKGKIFRLVVMIILLTGAFAAWRLFGPDTDFSESKASFYIRTGSSFDDVINGLAAQHILKNPGTFRWVAARLGYDQKVKAGRYVIENGSSIYTVVKKLRSGRQTAISLVINKLRTKGDLAKKVGANFECDSATFMRLLNNTDSLKKYELDTNTVMTAVIPNTYSILWNTPPQAIFKKLYEAEQIFWNDARRQQAAALNLTTGEAYTLASIIEEETNKDADKGKIGSVYLNRLQKGMKLGADPTIKFAMNNFGLKRIYDKYLLYPSPYNTYLHAGLPPGPVCTPSAKTIDAVLNAPVTNYLYFVAKPDLKGFSNFATTYDEHMRFARQYQAALDSLVLSRGTPGK